MKAVILAGGEGTRLRPYTTAFPKPLMPIGNRPILDILVRQLKVQGFEEVIILVGYLDGLIRAYFGDGSKFGVSITYVKEDRPLGTVGGLSLIRQELNESFLMINGDTLTTMQFSDIIHDHDNSHAAVTIALNERQVMVDFGVVEIDANKEVKDYTEKPVLSNLVSTGVNVLSPGVLTYIEPDKYMNFPGLIKKLVSAGEKVMGYLFDGYWLDIGRAEDYEKANAEIEDISAMMGIGTDGIGE